MLKHLFQCFAGGPSGGSTRKGSRDSATTPPVLPVTPTAGSAAAPASAGAGSTCLRVEQSKDHASPSQTPLPRTQSQTVIKEAPHTAESHPQPSGWCPEAADRLVVPGSASSVIFRDLQRNLARLRPPGAAALVALLPVAEAATLLLASDGSDWPVCAPYDIAISPPPPQSQTTPRPDTAYRALTLAASPGFSVLFNGARTSRSCDALMHLLLSADGRARTYFGQAAARAVAAAGAEPADTAATGGTSGEQSTLDLGGPYGWSFTATPLVASSSEGGRVFPTLLVSWPLPAGPCRVAPAWWALPAGPCLLGPPSWPLPAEPCLLAPPCWALRLTPAWWALPAGPYLLAPAYCLVPACWPLSAGPCLLPWPFLPAGRCLLLGPCLLAGPCMPGPCLLAPCRPESLCALPARPLPDHSTLNPQPTHCPATQP